MRVHNYDFSGWATKNDLLCSDGRIIRDGAFRDCDGIKVPLVWNHGHNDPTNVLGHALLENRPGEGVYAYCKFNKTPKASHIKKALVNGDLNGLSIYANHLTQKGGDVLHGSIRELSLVLSRANPGAMIDTVLAHSDYGEDAHFPDDEDRGIIWTGEPIVLYHSEDDYDEVYDDYENDENDDEGDNNMNTIGDVLDTLDDDQRAAVEQYVDSSIDAAIDATVDAIEEEYDDGDYDGDYDDGDDDYDYDYDYEEDGEMSHSIFESPANQMNVLTHSDEVAIINSAKEYGSFKKALQDFAEESGVIMHGDTSMDASGFEADNIELLFPEFQDLHKGAPELLTDDQGWVGKVMDKVHKSPIPRIRTGQVDIRNIEKEMDDLRARGYKKGNRKKIEGNFKLVRRTTAPTTVYVRNELHRDDIVDIEDFDYVEYLYKIDRMHLNEELATAIMIGDGRDMADADKISEENIRPIWTDADLYTIKYPIDLQAARNELQGTDTSSYFGENYIYAEAMVNACLYSREKFKGSGQPDMFITPHMLNVMLLARDRNGRRIYSGISELAAALNVNSIITAEQFAGKTRTFTPEGSQVQETRKLLALMVNLSDYHLGANKKGQVAHFTDFDIDFNKQKSLLETRVSGALTKCYSAIAIEEKVENVNP